MTRLPMIPQEWLEADLVGLVFSDLPSVQARAVG